MDDRSPLGDYLQAHIDRYHAGSRNAFSGRARDPETGQHLLNQWISDLIQGKVARAPEQWRFRALAEAAASSGNAGSKAERYRKHLSAIRRLAAAQWLGFDELLESPDESIATFRVPAGLSEEKRMMVIQWAEMMARDLASM